MTSRTTSPDHKPTVGYSCLSTHRPPVAHHPYRGWAGGLVLLVMGDWTTSPIFNLGYWSIAPGFKERVGAGESQRAVAADVGASPREVRRIIRSDIPPHPTKTTRPSLKSKPGGPTSGAKKAAMAALDRGTSTPVRASIGTISPEQLDPSQESVPQQHFLHPPRPCNWRAVRSPLADRVARWGGPTTREAAPTRIALARVLGALRG